MAKAKEPKFKVVKGAEGLAHWTSKVDKDGNRTPVVYILGKVNEKILAQLKLNDPNGVGRFIEGDVTGLKAEAEDNRPGEPIPVVPEEEIVDDKKDDQDGGDQ